MKDKEFLVIIQSNKEGKKKVLSGILQEKDGDEKKFEPLTVLGDLLNIVEYKEDSSYPQDNYTFRQNYIEHPFFLGKVFDGDTRFREPWRFRPFFVALNELKEIIINNRRLTANEIEILKQFLSLTFTFRMEFKELNPLYELGYIEFKGKKVEKYQYSPLDYRYDFDVNTVLSKNNNKDYRFTYSCHSIEDIMFSVLHYMMLLGYQFARCSHCGKYFATKTLKQKYCTRKSPYKGQEQNECERAVKTVFQDFRRRYKRIYQRLNNNYTSEEAINTFLGEYHKLLKLARDFPTVENLDKLEQYLGECGSEKRKYTQKTRLKNENT